MNDIRLRPVIAAMGVALYTSLFFTGTTVRSQGEDRIVTTKHQVLIDGKPLSYTARAGCLPIRDNETGEVHGQMFFVAYTVQRAPNAPLRPLTFAWNGGPGSSSSLVHLLGFGPRRLGPTTDAATKAAARFEPLTKVGPIDNDGTWLDFSDLVFVDPIGAGYSRPAVPLVGT